MKHSWKALIVVLFAYFVPETLAAPIAGDYDGDGKSDLSIVRVSKRRNTSRWSVRFADGSTKTFGFQVKGDALAPGNYSGETVVKPAVVFVRDINLKLEWHIKQGASNSDQLISFGSPGDTPVPGDYDCDGTTDRAVRRLKNDNGRWYIAKSSGGSANSISFGKSGDRVFAADADGDGCDEMFSIRVKNGLIYWYFRSLGESGSSEIQWGLSGDIPLEPLDLNSDGIPDFIVVRKIGTTNFAFVRYSDSQSATFNVGPSSTVPLTGNFTGVNGFAYYDRNNSRFGIINQDTSTTLIPFGSNTGALVRPDGSVVQAGETITFGDAGSSDPGDTDGICDKTLKNRDGSGNFVHNPENSKNTIKEVLPSQFTTQVQSVQALKDGKIIDNLDFKSGYEWGGRERWYGDETPASYPKNLTIRITLKTGTRYCVNIPDPTQRYD